MNRITDFYAVKDKKISKQLKLCKCTLPVYHVNNPIHPDDVNSISDISRELFEEYKPDGIISRTFVYNACQECIGVIFRYWTPDGFTSKVDGKTIEHLWEDLVGQEIIENNLFNN